MSYLSFQDSLSFAKAINAGDTINPLKSNNLNPLSYSNPKDLSRRMSAKIFKLKNVNDQLFYLKKLTDRKLGNDFDFKTAAEYGDIRAFKFLLDNRYKLSNDFYIYLAIFGRTSVLTELINYIGHKPDYFVNVLNNAIKRKDLEAVKAILSLGFPWQDLVSADQAVAKNFDSLRADSKYLEIKKLIGDARKQALASKRIKTS
jgi:hypothetical protein